MIWKLYASKQGKLEALIVDKIHGMTKEKYEVKICTIIYTHIVIKLFS